MRESCREEAIRSLSEECGLDKKHLLEKMLSLANAAGEATVARDVRESLRNLRKNELTHSTDVAVGIRTARLERARVAEANRERLAEKDREMKELKARTKLAEVKRQVAAAEARKASSDAKMMESRRKMHVLTSTARQAKMERENRVIAHCYAAEVSEKLQRLSHAQQKRMFDASGRRVEMLRKKTTSLPRHVPGCWPKEVGKKDLRKVVAPRSEVEGDVYASEAFIWKLYGNRRPQDVHPLDAQPSFKLARLLEQRLPGWERLFKSRWSALGLITVSGSIADATFLNIVHMYKHMLGSNFPAGVFDWPPREWVQSYSERKKRVAAAREHGEEPEGKQRGRLGAADVEEKTRTEAAGCQPKRAAAGCQPKRAAAGSKPKRAGDGHGSSASSSSKEAHRESTAPVGMLKLAEKWGVDASGKL